ncbi:MAG: hypothetical protein Sapg2KO_17220 [Saprospiraceae bacterium]
MGNALLNFRQLAELEEREPRVVEMIENFEAHQSDFIRESIQSSLSFMRLFGDIAQLYFPTMLDIAVTGLSDKPQPNRISDQGTVEKVEDINARTPDLGGKEPPSPTVPGADGPTKV